jgi:hypothetical protein
MFHLFDKVYLDFDSKISSEIKRIVISERCGFADRRPHNGLTPFQQEQVHAARTIEDLIGKEKQYKTDLEFFKYLKNLGDLHSGPFVVYCDKNAFLYLFISWHKSILENVSSENLWKIFQFFIEKETYLSKIFTQSSSIGARPNPFTFLEFQIENWSESEFNSKYTEIIARKDRQWNFSMISNFGIEYLLSSYLTTTTEQLKEKIKTSLKNRLLLLSSRSILSEIYESKFELIRNYQNKKLHDILEVEAIEDLNDLFLHPKLSIYKDSTIWNESNVFYPSSIESSLDFSLLNPEKTTKLIDSYTFIKINFDGMSLSSSPIQIINRLPMVVLNSISDNELIDLLNNELFYASSICEDVDMQKVNSVFIDWCLKLFRTNNLSLINGCSIAI